jgi:hypothetical protein
VRRRAFLAAAGVVLLAAVVWWLAAPSDDKAETADVDVRWGGSEGHPSCVYDPTHHAVDAKLRIDGTAPRRREVIVTVTAYADENTSDAVGSHTRRTWVEGTVHERLVVNIPVVKAPHVDIDGETACKLSMGSR